MFSTKAVILASLFVTSIANAVINDLPNAKWNCRETSNGALIADGAKTLTISRDQFGTYYLNLIQKDQFSGNQTIVDNINVAKQKCSGFTACELYVGEGINFFVNLVPNSKLQSAHLDLTSGQDKMSLDFACKSN